MVKTVGIILIVLVATYILSFIFFTNKYTVMTTANTCATARTVSYEWQRKFFFLAAYSEMVLSGFARSDRLIRLHSKELHNYFSEQVCTISEGQVVGTQQ